MKKRLTWKRSLDGCEDVGLREGVTVGEAICKLADLEARDTVEVVRCKDCVVPHNKWTGCPKLNGLVPPPEHFCSYGERRNNG